MPETLGVFFFSSILERFFGGEISQLILCVCLATSASNANVVTRQHILYSVFFFVFAGKFIVKLSLFGEGWDLKSIFPQRPKLIELF